VIILNLNFSVQELRSTGSFLLVILDIICTQRDKAHENKNVCVCVCEIEGQMVTELGETETAI
jgi:hypothetical protein